MKRIAWLHLAEPAVVFALIMLYIWRLRYTWPYAWICILAFLLLSHIVHKEPAATLGFRWNNFGECMQTLAPALLMLALSLIAGGLLLQTIRNISFEHALLCLAFYCPWGLFQQYLLNGYLASLVCCPS